MNPTAMITAVGVSDTAQAPLDAAIIAMTTTITSIIMIIPTTEVMRDTHRPTGPRLPGDRRRPFQVDPEATDLRLKRWW
jgi:hypothetical protein